MYKETKNDKAPGDDMLRNEFIKSTSDMFLVLYVDLFNLIFNSGKIPDTCSQATLYHFIKTKGQQLIPKTFDLLPF